MTPEEVHVAMLTMFDRNTWRCARALLTPLELKVFRKARHVRARIKARGESEQMLVAARQISRLIKTRLKHATGKT